MTPSPERSSPERASPETWPGRAYPLGAESESSPDKPLPVTARSVVVLTRIPD